MDRRATEHRRIEEGRAAFRARPGVSSRRWPISSSLPAADRPEIAFAGRSNVGKSSLINALDRPQRDWRASRTRRGARARSIFFTARAGAYARRHAGLWLCPRRKAPGARAGKRLITGLSARPASSQTRVRADRCAPWPQAGRRGDLRAARRGGGQLSGRPDQGRQAEACRARHNAWPKRRNACASDRRRIPRCSPPRA